MVGVEPASLAIELAEVDGVALLSLPVESVEDVGVALASLAVELAEVGRCLALVGIWLAAEFVEVDWVAPVPLAAELVELAVGVELVELAVGVVKVFLVEVVPVSLSLKRVASATLATELVEVLQVEWDCLVAGLRAVAGQVMVFRVTGVVVLAEVDSHFRAV